MRGEIVASEPDRSEIDRRGATFCPAAKGTKRIGHYDRNLRVCEVTHRLVEIAQQCDDRKRRLADRLYRIGDERQLAAVEHVADELRREIEDAIAQTRIRGSRAVVQLVRVQHVQLAGQGDVLRAAIAEPLHAGQGDAERVAVMPVRLIGTRGQGDLGALKAGAAGAEADPVAARAAGSFKTTRIDAS